MKRYFLSTLFVLNSFIGVLQPKKYLVEVKNDEDDSKVCACSEIYKPVCGSDGKDN